MPPQRRSTVDQGALTTDDLTVYWANRGTASSDTENVLLGDPATRHMVIEFEDTGGTNRPAAYPFGDDDTFIVGQNEDFLTFAQFIEVLRVAADSRDMRIMFNAGVTVVQTELTWTGYDYNRPTDKAIWELTGLTCNAASGD